MSDSDELLIEPTPRVALQHVAFHNAGHCSQNEYFVGARTFRSRKFQAVVVCLKHPVHGTALIDTGYCPRYFEATRKLPGRIMQWLLPVARMPDQDPKQRWRARGIQIGGIRNIFLSHFHVDHIGGTTDFPEATFICRSAPLQELERLGTFRQLREGFLHELLPTDFRERITDVEEARFRSVVLQSRSDGPVALPFRGIDWWGDGSLILLDMPGHAAGHTGYLLRTKESSILYVVDASWDLAITLDGRSIPWPARRLQHDPRAYQETQKGIVSLVERFAGQIVACHCPMSQQRPDHHLNNRDV